MSPGRVCLGLSLYNEKKYLAAALDSLVRQNYKDFSIHIFDNGSTDGSIGIVEEAASRDKRIFFERSQVNKGMIHGFRRAFEMASSTSPEMVYFSWGSGHDLWHPDWLGKLLREMENSVETVLVYPVAGYVDDQGMKAEKRTVYFDTAGLEPAGKRFRYVCDRITGAGNMAYGLYRSQALRDSGVYRLVLLPDRLLMMELSLRGQFLQVPEVLWYRRVQVTAEPEERRGTIERQKLSLFESGKRPMYAVLPWWSIFGVTFFRHYFLRKPKHVNIRRWEGLRMTFYLIISQWFQEAAKASTLFLKRLLSRLGLKDWAQKVRRERRARA